MKDGSNELLKPGAIVDGRYTITTYLGYGGAGVVYQARHIVLGNIYAIKFLHPHRLQDKFLKRFELEAKAVSALKHSGIVGVHDYGITTDGAPYLVMEYIEGQSLNDIVEKHGPLSEERFHHVFQQVIDALAHAHDRGVVHRDLKPENIILTKGGDGQNVAKIVDFGYAKILPKGALAPGNLTEVGSVFGTPRYMSPEQCKGQPVDERADIYALACVMYSALTGKFPFDGDAVYEIIEKQVFEMPAPIGDSRDDLKNSEALEAIIFKALAKDPAQRYQSMEELAQALKSLREERRLGWIAKAQATHQLAVAKLYAKSARGFQLSPAATLQTLAQLSSELLMLIRWRLRKSVAFMQQALTEAQQDKRAFYRSLARILPLVLVVSVVTALIHNLGWLQGLEATSLDTLIRLNPVAAKHVFVVEITDDDYQSLFGARSPLAPNKVAELISDIAAGEPQVIVVDLDTADPSFRNLTPPSTNSRIVWARSAHPAVDGGGASPAADEAVTFIPDSVLGDSVHSSPLLSGISVLPQDPDGTIRHYSRCVETVDPTSHLPSAAPTLPWAAALAYRGIDAPACDGGAGQMVLALSSGSKSIPHLSAGNLLALYNGQGWKDTVKGKVVLLGGAFQAARDNYNTPVGAMPGVEIVAQAVESELQRGGIRSASQPMLILAQVLASLLVAVINYIFVRSWIPLAGLAVIPIAAFLFSLVSFSSLYLWVDFVPALLAVQLYYALEHMRKSGERAKDARTDALTGLHNKRFLYELLPKVFKSTASGIGQRPVSIVMIDGDHFKAVNDTYGHKIGDEMLRELAGTIQSCVRTRDSEGHQPRGTDYVIRFGGEEFMVVMDDADSNKAVKVAERIREAVEHKKTWPGAVPAWTVSAGVATFPQDGLSSDELIERADRALYYVKNDLGRNRVCHSQSVPATFDIAAKLPALRGELGGFDAAGLLQSIAINQKTGVLTARSSSGNDLWILFLSGQPLQAKLGRHAGPAALTEFLVTFSTGSFNFQERKEPDELKQMKLDSTYDIEKSLERCLMDGALACDHFQSAHSIIPSSDVHLVSQPQEEFNKRWYALAELKEPPAPEEFNCMSEIAKRADGSSSLTEIFNQLEQEGILTHLMWRAAAILVENGLVQKS